MALHKMVNGVRVDLTEEEEEAIRKEWAENEAKIQAKKEARGQEIAEKERVISKLLSGLTKEEADLIKPKLM